MIICERLVYGFLSPVGLETDSKCESDEKRRFQGDTASELFRTSKSQNSLKSRGNVAAEGISHIMYLEFFVSFRMRSFRLISYLLPFPPRGRERRSNSPLQRGKSSPDPSESMAVAASKAESLISNHLSFASHSSTSSPDLQVVAISPSTTRYQVTDVKLIKLVFA